MPGRPAMAAPTLDQIELKRLQAVKHAGAMIGGCRTRRGLAAGFSGVGLRGGGTLLADHERSTTRFH